MRKFLLLFAALALSLIAFSQTVLYEDDFESYTVGTYIAVDNPTWWTTWSNDPGSGEDAKISDVYSNSPTKSILINKVGTAATDLILKLGDKVSGVYEVNWYIYVPAGKAGYYNFQHFQDLPGTEWAL